MPRTRQAEHRTDGPSPVLPSRLLAALLLLFAAPGCGGEEGELTDDLAGPPDPRPAAELAGPHGPPWWSGGDPILHMKQGLDSAGVTGAERAKVDALLADFETQHADVLAKLARAAAKAKAEADQDNAPDRERWHALLAAEGLAPGALGDEMRTLRRSIADLLPPEQRQKLRAAARGAAGGRFGHWGKRVMADLALTPDQEREIQRLVTDFGDKHQGEIRALRAVVEKQGDFQRGRGPHRGRGPGAGSGSEPGAGPSSGGPGRGSGAWLGPHLRGEYKDALIAGGHDPEAFRKDVVMLHDQALALLTAEQKAKLNGHGLGLLRRLLAPEPAGAPAKP